jgi:hypothetical protein
MLNSRFLSRVVCLAVAAFLLTSRISNCQETSPAEAARADTARMIAEQDAIDKAAQNSRIKQQEEMQRMESESQRDRKKLDEKAQKEGLKNSKETIAQYKFDVANPRSRGTDSLITEFTLPEFLHTDQLSMGGNFNIAHIALQSSKTGNILGLISLQNAKLIEQNDQIIALLTKIAAKK